MQPILVTGGTGTLGRAVVARLLDAGQEVRVASRRPDPAIGGTEPAEPPGAQWATVNYRTGLGVDDAVDGVAAIVHCAGEFRHVNVDRQLIDAARRAGGPHLVYISIVGVDRVPFGYYKVKLTAERLIENSGLPWSILRTTQFHDFVPRLWGPLTRLPVVPVPAGTDIQPVDVREVAARLTELAAGAPAGRVPDVAGPQIHHFADVVRAYLRARRLRRALLPVRFPGKTFQAYRAGGHLAPDRAVGRITFDEFLAERYSPTNHGAER